MCVCVCVCVCVCARARVRACVCSVYWNPYVLQNQTRGGGEKIASSPLIQVAPLSETTLQTERRGRIPHPLQKGWGQTKVAASAASES